MPAQIISGTDTARTLRAELAERVAALRAGSDGAPGWVPGLATVLVGEDPASRAYVGMKNRAAKEVGIHSRQIDLPADIAEDELLGWVEGLNADPEIHGILVQLPLPGHIDEARILEAILPEKDVDGFHPVNVGRLSVGDPRVLAPCTPRGIVELLLRSGHDPSGKHVVVVGRSNIVGRPMASLLLKKGRGGDATVTVAHSRTADLPAVTRLADILVVAVGRPGTVTADMVSPGCRGDRRGREPRRRSRCRAGVPPRGRRGLRGCAPGGGGHHPRARRRGPHDHCHPALEHGRGRRGDPGSGARRGVSGEEPELDLFSAPPDADAGPGPEEATEPRVWSVSEINQALRALLEDTLPALWIGGEVANWTRARSGHCYFTLKDERAQLRCVMWRPQAARLPMDPDEGMRVRLHGSVTLYEARGETQFVVRELQAEGEEGLWKLAFEKLRKRSRPKDSWTRPGSAPSRAFRARWEWSRRPRGGPPGHPLGDPAARALDPGGAAGGPRAGGGGLGRGGRRHSRPLAHGEVDVLIVGRGGGSIEDLWAFNEEPVLRAIAAAPVPVISAVGHETDVTLADLVADLRAPTPSAAAEAAVQDGAAVLDVLTRVRPRLARGLRGQVERRRLRGAGGDPRGTGGGAAPRTAARGTGAPRGAAGPGRPRPGGAAPRPARDAGGPGRRPLAPFHPSTGVHGGPEPRGPGAPRRRGLSGPTPTSTCGSSMRW
jgi:methylenetetrahydrofolate dehydrogenase (NADP+) / methenyltetrahydrofolate cyclohydrolase